MKWLHSDGSLLPEWKGEWEESQEDIFFLGFSFRDGQDLWLNSYFAFMNKILPDYEVWIF